MGPEGFRHLPGYFARAAQHDLLTALRRILAAAPLYRPHMPRTGKPMSVRMSNCGPLGWVTDAARGYRYQVTHPETGHPWPDLPRQLVDVWREVAPGAPPPQACLINYYDGAARLGSHVDADEEDKAAPVVSVSLGDDGLFHIGGSRRSDPKVRVLLRSGDVLVLGGASRLAYHGIDRIIAGSSDLLAEGGRFNLTLRRVTRVGAGQSLATCARDTSRSISRGKK